MEGKDTAGNTGTVSRRLKEKLAVEDIYGVEESEEVDTEKIEDCEIIIPKETLFLLQILQI